MHLDVETARARSLRDLVVALGLAAVAVPGMVPLAGRSAARSVDPVVLIAWLSLVAPTAGACSVALRLRPWPFGAAVCGAWAIALATLAPMSERLLPAPLWAALALGGLFFTGVGVAGTLRAPARALAPVAALSLALACLPLCAGWLGRPWPARAAELAFECSPLTLVAECAGLDWMRVDAVYTAAGTDRFERRAWTPELAGPLALLVGCSLAFAAAQWRRRSAQRAS